jgi:succinoglycan biosynthesis protein ExoA
MSPGPLAALPPLPADPPVAVVIPARDAADDLPGCLEAVLPQLGPQDEVAVVVADPVSAHAARTVAAADRRVTVVDNPVGSTPSALNRGVAATSAPVIVRIDVQARVPADYVRRVVALLARPGAVNAGGRQVPVADAGVAAAVAAAMRSPLGSGGAAYRHGGGAVRPVDTVYLGAYRRDALAVVGGFDERFLRNQDAECNERLRRAGGTVLLDPTLEVRYRPRGTMRALWRQYREYGRWRRATARLHPGSLAARQRAPVALVLVLAGTALLAAAGAASGAPTWTLVPFAAAWGGYGLVIIGGALVAAGARPRRVPRIAAALVVLHVAWGLGFLAGPPRRHEA